MKKALLLWTIFIGMIFSSIAQKGHFGFRAGAANAGYYGSDYGAAKSTQSISPIWTPTVGVYVNSEINKYFWIKTEFNYVNRGYTHEQSGNTLRTNYYYVDVYPINPTFHFKGGQIFVGPTISVLVASNKDTLIAGQVKKVSDTDLKGFNRYDIGVMAGIEYEFKFGVNVGVRMVRGFTSIKQPAEDTHIQTQWFNQTFLITAGYTLGKHQK
ncbi:MAG: PorT family protein [Cytophagales bacterium]|nr:PorT family protein [Cytophaga sp.]